jgi:hypothetical protein
MFMSKNMVICYHQLNKNMFIKSYQWTENLFVTTLIHAFFFINANTTLDINATR